MAYIHNKKDPKVDDSLIDGGCPIEKAKEILMKYGYNCEDIDDKTVKKPFPILDEVRKILTGDRRSTYGDAEKSFKRIADYWNCYLMHTRDVIEDKAKEEDLPYSFLRGAYLQPEDVAMMMILFKLAREENKHSHDNLVDIIGYSALADILANRYTFTNKKEN